MPIYEYNCAQCQKDFEELVLSSRETVVCPACGSDNVVKKLSVFSYSSGGTFHSSEGCGCGGCHKSSCSGCNH